jgi:DNA-binding IclR family transcriptional regulator
MPRSASGPSGSRKGIQSVGVGLRVLDTLVGLGEPSTLGAVAQASGLSTSQTHRYLSSLIAAGMAQQDAATGRYDLGPAALRLGLGALARIDAFRIADAAISDFARRTGRTVQIAALGPLGPTIVRWILGRPPVVTSFNVGSVLPMLHSATGQAFLAFVPEGETQPIVDRELATKGVRPVDVQALKARVREAGYASVDGTVAPGLRAAAFPIFDLQGRAVLTATVLATEAFDPAGDAAVRDELGTVCGDVSLQLGYRPH